MQGRVMTERQAAQRAQIQGEIDGLTAQRGELQMQQKALAERRNQLFAQSHTTNNAAARGELEARMAEIDARAARLDRQIDVLNERISDAMGRLSSAPAPQAPVRVDIPRIVQGQEIRIPSFPPVRRGPDMREVGGMMAAEAILLALIGFTFWRFGVRRMRDQFERMFSAQTQQLAQLQQAVDTVAIEVERISEAQRYVAKVITDGSGSGARKDAIPARRDG